MRNIIKPVLIIILLIGISGGIYVSYKEINTGIDDELDSITKEEQLEELGVLLNGVDTLSIESSNGYRIAPFGEGYTVLGRDESEEFIIASKYETGNVITLGTSVHDFLFKDISDDKKQFMDNIYEFSGLESDESALFDGRRLYIGFRNQYSKTTEGLMYSNGKVDNLDIIKNHKLIVLCAEALEHYNYDNLLGEALKDFLSEGNTLVIGTETAVNDNSHYKRFMREIGVNVTNNTRGALNESFYDITKEEMIEIDYLNEINRIKEIEENNENVVVTNQKMEELSYFYGIDGFNDEDYDELGIQFPYTYDPESLSNSPYTRAMVYGRARTNDFSAGQPKDPSVYYEGKETVAGDMSEVFLCKDGHYTNCNKAVTETITMKSAAERKVLGGGYVTPTGLYLTPGEDINIKFEIKDEIMKEAVRYQELISFTTASEYGGLSIDAEVHNRPPGYRRQRFFSVGEYTISSPIGGAIYLEMIPNIEGLEVEVTIDGAVKMATYEEGKTTIEDLETQLDTYNVDKVIIFSDRNMISTTRLTVESYLESGTLENSLNELDEIYENNVSLLLGNGTVHKNEGLYTRPPEGHRVWWQEDIQIKAGWMLSGYPIHTHATYGLLNEVPEDSFPRRWGEAHELGHNTQFHVVGFDNTVEVTVNINSLYQEYMRDEPLRTYASNRDDFTDVISFFDKGNKMDDWGVLPSELEGKDVALTFYIQMTIGYHHLNGSNEKGMFDFYTEIYRELLFYNNEFGGWQHRNGMLMQYLGMKDISLKTPYDHMYVEASRLYGFDVYEMMDKYGAANKIDPEIREEIKANFPEYKKISTPNGELYIHQMVPASNPGDIAK